MTVKLKPLGDQVAVIRDEIEKTTESGIVFAETSKVVPGSGIVFAHGIDAVEVKDGDRVYFSALTAARNASAIEVEHQEFLMIAEKDLFCVVS